MGTTGNENKRTVQGSARPSLLSHGTTAPDLNILDTVGQHGDAKVNSVRSNRLLWLLLPVLATVAWLVSTRQDKAPTPPATVVAVATPTPPPPAPSPASPPPAVAAENSVPAETAGDPFSTLTSAPEPTPTTQATLNAGKPVEATTPTPPHKPTPVTDKPVTNKPAPKPPATAAVAASPKPAAPQVKPGTAVRNPPVRSDPDVALLDAIMKHLDEGGDKTAGSTRSPQTIADLVKSCQSRDAIETLLCQRRICDGSWGKAQACPIDLAPKSTAAAR